MTASVAHPRTIIAISWLKDGQAPGKEAYRVLRTNLQFAAVDPWGNAYIITTDPDFEHKPLVVSCGPDGELGTADALVDELYA